MAAVTVPRERHILLVAARPHPVPLTTLALPLLLQEPLWAVTSLSGQRLALTICPHGQLGRIVIVQVSVILVACHVTLLFQIKTEHLHFKRSVIENIVDTLSIEYTLPSKLSASLCTI